ISSTGSPRRSSRSVAAGRWSIRARMKNSCGAANSGRAPPRKPRCHRPPPVGAKAQPQEAYEARKRQEAEARRERKAADARRRRLDELENRIAEREQSIKDIEATMSAPGFYDDHE